jgi:hypothetical protein
MQTQSNVIDFTAFREKRILSQVSEYLTDEQAAEFIALNSKATPSDDPFFKTAYCPVPELDTKFTSKLHEFVANRTSQV